MGVKIIVQSGWTNLSQKMFLELALQVLMDIYSCSCSCLSFLLSLFGNINVCVHFIFGLLKMLNLTSSTW